MSTAELVKQLRERTGAGMLDCKKALEANNGDIEKAIEDLRKKGLAQVAKKAGRIAAEGVVDAYIHGNGRIGVLVEVNIETDFAAKNEEFRSFVKDIAMQVAASRPEYVDRDDVPAAVLDKEREIIRAQSLKEGKPDNVVEKMLAGRIEKYYKDVCLLEQPWIKDPSMTIRQLLNERIAKIGENINIRRFVRFERGEGLARREENFADEVNKQINK
ncbi:MAG: translation elongation factor Ts [Oscillospiraceae bacterium]|nr:translation elongation factor Ts [Oscillospiraceae bacterium]